MRKRRAPFALLLIALVPALASATPPTINKLSAEVSSRIDQEVQNFMAKDSIPGTELAVLVNGQTIYECGYGFADPQAQRTPDPDTAFQIDSVTKSFTAMAILKLVEDGKLDLEDPISKYINVPNEAWGSIPISMLMTMTSGIPTGGTMTGSYRNTVERAAHKQAAFGMGLAFRPGTGYLYSNVAYFLLGEIVERASGQTYIEYERSKILDPLGMSHTGFVYFDTLEDKAVPFIDGRPVKPRLPISGFSGGGLTSNIRDMERFGNAIYNRKILSDFSYKAMWTHHFLPDGRCTNWGMGWNVKGDEMNHFSAVFGKNGGGYGWDAQINYYVDKGIVVVVLANSESKGINGLCLNLARAVARQE